MDELSVEKLVELQSSNLCINCGKCEADEKYPNKLCTDCRDSFIKFPIPLWIKIFAAAVGAVVLISMVTLPKSLSTSIHHKRGMNAEAEKII